MKIKKAKGLKMLGGYLKSWKPVHYKTSRLYAMALHCACFMAPPKNLVYIDKTGGCYSSKDVKRALPRWFKSRAIPVTIKNQLMQNWAYPTMCQMLIEAGFKKYSANEYLLGNLGPVEIHYLCGRFGEMLRFLSDPLYRSHMIENLSQVHGNQNFEEYQL